MSLTLASRQVLMASIVSASPVAMGFSQNTCLPAAAHACRRVLGERGWGNVLCLD